MSGPDALTRSVLADQVKERLLEAILDGSYPPDSRIVETAVAKELGTSQAPVREALRGLEALGIVEITPFRGARVRRLDSAELLEAYVVRSAIEVLGARLAVARLTDEDVAALARLGTDMRAAADAGDGRDLAIVDAGGLAMPSSIAALTAAAATPLVLAGLRNATPAGRTMAALLLTGTVAVGVCMVYLGAHWPSDVLVGWALGAAIGAVLFHLLQRWGRRRPAEDAGYPVEAPATCGRQVG